MLTQYTFQQISQILDGQVLQLSNSSHPIQHLLLDSRLVIFPATALFIALPGNRNDGHDYLEEVYSKGVRNFIVSQKTQPPKLPHANLLRVENSLLALQNLARHHRRQFDIPVIGITGSNGKTIVKEWLFQLLHEDFKMVRSPKSYNSQTGVPLSVWQMKVGDELAIFEAGISTVGEMERLAPIIHCDIGIFTHIGPAHDAGFESMDQKILEKLSLFHQAETLIFSADDEKVAGHIQSLPIKNPLSWSLEARPADLQITAFEKTTDGFTRLNARFQDRTFSFSIPYHDRASIHNALHCCLLMLHLNYSEGVIRQRMRRLESIAMRLELKAGANGCSIINDSYNSDLHALQIALDFLDQHSHQRQRCLILSDILQSGLPQDSLYQRVAELLAEKNISQLIGIGEAVGHIDKYLPASIKASFFHTTTQYLQQLSIDDFHQTVVLLKGARQFEFERIANRLLMRVHKTRLEVKLDALTHNLNVYSEYLRSSTLLMVMVKAAAYGSGSVQVARLLEFLQLDYLSVAYADEGVELREAGIQLPILVLNPEAATFESMFRYELEPEIYSLSLLQQLLAALPPGKGAKIHIKLDTGMHRLGFEEKHLKELIELLGAHPQLEVKSVFSHLSASESAEHDAFSLQQIARFENMYRRLCTALNIHPLRHILNSAGIIRFPDYQMDMVRLGIGLYGIDSSGSIQNRLQSVLRLTASISQIKQLKAQDTVGYGRFGQVDQPARIGTVSIGYADGLLRRAGQGAFHLMVHGQAAPIVGNVCMDMCMIDLTQIPQAQEGDEVVIFGPEQPVQVLADCLHTIPYEVFTTISSRVRRVYFKES